MVFVRIVICDNCLCYLVYFSSQLWMYSDFLQNVFISVENVIYKLVFDVSYFHSFLSYVSLAVGVGCVRDGFLLEAFVYHLWK